MYMGKIVIIIILLRNSTRKRIMFIPKTVIMSQTIKKIKKIRNAKITIMKVMITIMKGIAITMKDIVTIMKNTVTIMMGIITRATNTTSSIRVQECRLLFCTLYVFNLLYSADVIQSIGLLISALIIFFVGSNNGQEVTEWNNWHYLDPISTYVFSIIVILSTIPIVKNCYNLIMEATPDRFSIVEIKK